MEAKLVGEEIAGAVAKIGVSVAEAASAVQLEMAKAAEATPAKGVALAAEMGSAFGASDLGALLAFFLIVKAVLKVGPVRQEGGIRSCPQIRSP